MTISGAIFSHIDDFIIILIFQCDHIDFDSYIVLTSRFYSVQNLRQIATSGNFAKAPWLETIHAYIDSPHP